MREGRGGQEVDGLGATKRSNGIQKPPYLNREGAIPNNFTQFRFLLSGHPFSQLLRLPSFMTNGVPCGQSSLSPKDNVIYVHSTKTHSDTSNSHPLKEVSFNY